MDATSKSKITFSTHNVNGYKRSKEFLNSQCENNPNSIRAIQEHWLRPPYKKQFGVNQLRCLHPDFDGFGTSAMSRSCDSKVNTGRPYGGTGFIFNKKYAKCLKPLISYSHERVTVLELSTKSEKIIVINCYFPFYNTKDLDTYTAMYRDTVGFLDNVMSQNREAKFIILADFNCNIYDHSNRFTQILLPLLGKYKLTPALDMNDNFDPQSALHVLT